MRTRVPWSRGREMVLGQPKREQDTPGEGLRSLRGLADGIRFGRRSVRVAIRVGGAAHPVVGAVDLAWNGGVPRILGAHDPVALELVHDAACAVEAELQLCLE